MVHPPKVFRPYLDDVERLSYGKGAKKQRGTGSRFTCHRLNKDERTLFEFAKQTSYLTVKGTGYRKNRKGSPLCNIFRQRCDALEQLCVIVEKRADLDRVVIDFSTLRVRNDGLFVTLILENVFQAKYPDLYDLIIKGEDTTDDDSGGSKSDGLSGIQTPINWEAVRTKPIWGVDERLITVSCERDVAKSLAIDIIKESSKFTFDDQCLWESVHEDKDENNDDQSDCEIDFDDI